MAIESDPLSELRIDRSREGRNRRGLGIFLGIAAIVVVASALGWLVVRARRSPGVRVRPVVVSVGAASGAVLNASGYVTARRRATVSSKITGKVVEVTVEEGMAVEEGRILARLDDAAARTALAAAEAERDVVRQAAAETEAGLRLADKTLARARALAEEGVIGRAELDRAEAEADVFRARRALASGQLAAAERQVELRRIDLDDTRIRAPFTGVAVSKDAQPGEMISPISAGGGFTRTGICTIVDMSSLEIEVDVNESYINRVRPDQQVEATLDAYPEWKIPARVVITVPTADRQRATVKVRIAFESLDPRMLPDMGVKVAFLPSDQEERGKPSGRIVVPKEALRKDGARDVVFVFVDGKVERRAVQAGSTSTDGVEIVAGLREGEWVVVAGPPSLADGQAVRRESGDEPR